MEDSVMYNCEISGTEIVNNSTSGVTGVGGEGLYMGGLVGCRRFYDRIFKSTF